MEDALGPRGHYWPRMINVASYSPYTRLREHLAAVPRVWLVTGAAGFIGSHLVHELLTLNQVVVGLDDFSTGHQRNLDDVFRGRPEAENRFRLIEGDIRDLASCREACAGVDFVLHQAALASVPRSIHDPMTTHAVNVEGFLNVLTAARDAGVRRVVYASSSAVYGDITDSPNVEDRVGRVLSPYAASKASDELFAVAFQRAYGLETVGLRYFNVFGPRQDPSGAYAAVIPRWIAALLADEPCAVYGDGQASRDFIPVANAVQANLLAAAWAPAQATGEVYNIAGGRETSLNELFRMIRLGLAGYQPHVATSRPTYTAPRAGDIQRSVANITKARRALGYEPGQSVEQGLGLAIEWYVTGDVAGTPVGSGAVPSSFSTR